MSLQELTWKAQETDGMKTGDCVSNRGLRNRSNITKLPGNSPSDKERLKIRARKWEMLGLKSLSILAVIKSEPQATLDLREEMVDITDSAVHRYSSGSSTTSGRE